MMLIVFHDSPLEEFQFFHAVFVVFSVSLLAEIYTIEILTESDLKKEIKRVTDCYLDLMITR